MTSFHGEEQAVFAILKRSVAFNPRIVDQRNAARQKSFVVAVAIPSVATWTQTKPGPAAFSVELLLTQFHRMKEFPTGSVR